MGQKVGGYRRNIPYGEETVLLNGLPIRKKQGTNHESKLYKGWSFEVNPNGLVGWNRGTCGREENTYGDQLSISRMLRKELEEVRRLYGCDSNGLGRKGTQSTGYTVYGEYRSTQKEAKRGHQRSIRKKNREDRAVALERVTIHYEKRRKAKVERKRVDFKKRLRLDSTYKDRPSESVDLRKRVQRDKEGRIRALGRKNLSKRKKAEQRCETIALSGIFPVTDRRTNLITRELERNLNHMQILRHVENLRTVHSKTSRLGRKRLGNVMAMYAKEKERNPTKQMSSYPLIEGGYYGLNVTVKGPLEGSRRTLSHVIQVGTIPHGTKRARIINSHKHAKTTYGSMGVRVTYCYGRG